MNKFINTALQDISKYSEITDIINIDFGSSFSNFISKIYPYTDEDLWKLKYKISHMDNIYESNEIKIIFLDIYASEKIFVERKGIYVYKSVEELKNYIRNKYKNQVNNYAFDNIFHMTDDENEYEDTVKLIIKYIIDYFYSNKNGIDLDKILYKSVQCFDNNIGKRNKLFLFDRQIMYKEKKNGSLEDFAEVFCYQFLKKLDITTAEYYFASYKSINGVVTKNFINKEEIFIDGTHLIDTYLTYLETKKIEFNININHNIELITKYNNIEDLTNIFEIFSLVNNMNFNLIINQLKETFAIDLLFLQSDRNSNNWGILFNQKDGRIRFAPLYDNSNIFNFNKPDILKLMRDNINNEELIYSLSMENNPTLLRLHKCEDLFIHKAELIEKVDDEETIKFLKLLITKIDNYGLTNLINEIIDDFPKKLKYDEFRILITKLLSSNITFIKERLLFNKKILSK